MTKQFDVKLNTQREQVDFARVCNKYSFDILLCKGSYEVDAKSILGLMSLDYSKPVKIVVEDEDNCLLNILTRCLSDEDCLCATFERLNPCLKKNQ